MSKWDNIQKVIYALNNGKTCPILPRNITFGEVVETFFPELKDGEFDYALPLSWTKEVEEVTGKTPGDFVWFYPADKTRMSGFPYPITKNALDLLKEFNEKTGYSYPVPSE